MWLLKHPLKLHEVTFLNLFKTNKILFNLELLIWSGVFDPNQVLNSFFFVDDVPTDTLLIISTFFSLSHCKYIVN